MTVSSSTVLVGSPVTLTLKLKDQNGENYVVDSLSIIFSYTGGTSAGTFGSITSLGNGVYTTQFTGTTAGTEITLEAIVNGKKIISTLPTVTVNSGTPTKLLITQEPVTTQSGQIMSPVKVKITDKNNSIVTNYTGSVTIGILTNPSSGTLSGTLTKTATEGIVTYDDLSINFYGTGYNFFISSGVLTTAISESFDITASSVLSYDWPFTFSTTSLYDADWNLIELTSGGSASLTKALLEDSSTTEQTNSTFSTPLASQTSSGLTYGQLIDGSNYGIKLGNSGSCNGTTSPCFNGELNSSWTPQWSNLVSYWKFDGNWNDSKGTNNGTANGTPSATSDAKVGLYSGSFNGVDQSITTARVSSQTNNFTMSAWFKSLNPFQAGQMIFYNGSDSSGNGMGFALNRENTTIGRIYVLKGGIAWLDTVTPIKDSKWYHAVLTMSSTNIPKFYLNGTLVYTGGAGAPNTPTLKTEIGKNDYPALRHFYGYIDDVAFWNIELTASEISKIFKHQKAYYSGSLTSRIMQTTNTQSWTNLSWTTPFPFGKELPNAACSGATCTHTNSEATSSYSSIPGNLMNGIMGLWHLNESSLADVANEVKDDSGQGRHGRAKNGTIPEVNGVFGNAAKFDGVNDYIEIPTFELSYQSFTISTWVNPMYTGANVIYFNAYTSGAANESIHFAILSSGVFRFGYGVDDLDTTSSVINFGSWNHIVTMYNATTDTSTLYVNGNYITSSSAGPFIGANPTIRIGSGLNVLYLKGGVDELAIWNRPLSNTEVAELYQRGASRIKFQYKVCASGDPTCSSASWIGPNGSSDTFYSEIYNNSLQTESSGDTLKTSPSMSISGSGNYFQYKVILESDSSSASLFPELKTVNASPDQYVSTSPSIASKNGLEISDLTAFSETLGSACPAGIGYALSLDKTNWKYFNGTSWVDAPNNTPSSSSTVAQIQSGLSTFKTGVGRGTVYIKAYLKSNGAGKCELDNVQIQGIR